MKGMVTGIMRQKVGIKLGAAALIENLPVVVSLTRTKAIKRRCGTVIEGVTKLERGGLDMIGLS
jgi:hypothetical protein